MRFDAAALAAAVVVDRPQGLPAVVVMVRKELGRTRHERDHGMRRADKQSKRRRRKGSRETGWLGKSNSISTSTADQVTDE